MEVFQSPAELPTCSHLFPATPCAGFLGGGGEDLPFLRLYFYPAPRGFTALCLQKLKFKTSWGRLPGGRRCADSHVAARGFAEHHLAVPTPTPLALRRVEGSRTSSGCRRVYPCCSQRSRGRSFSGLSWKHDALGKALGWERCLVSPTLSLPSLYPS